MHNGDLNSLTGLLARRASSGNRLDVLEIKGSYIMYPGVEESIGRGVRKSKVDRIFARLSWSL